MEAIACLASNHFYTDQVRNLGAVLLVSRLRIVAGSRLAILSPPPTNGGQQCRIMV